jgi:rod shape-determining protein MreC
MGRDTRRTRLLLVALIVVAFTLITLDYRSGKNASGFRGAVHTVFGPIENGVTTVVRPIGRTASSLAHLGRDRKRADRLARENADLRRQLRSDGEARRETTALAKLRLLADKGQYTITPARLIAVSDASGTDWTITINAGRNDRVVPGRLVVNDTGLVGSVVSATATTSVVRLACDPQSHVGARLEGSRILGAVAGGEGPNRLTFTLYDASLRVQKGQRLVTFGSIDYPAGVPVGVVTAVLDGGEGLSRTAVVKPYVTFGSLDTVGVVVAKPPHDPGDRVLPPRPVPPTVPPTSAPPAQAGSATPGALSSAGAPNPATG